MILAMSTSNICILISITVYLIFVVLIGFKYSKESNSVDEYYLGGRKLGPLVTAMSAEASDMSSWLLMGFRDWLMLPVLQVLYGQLSD